MVIKNCIKYFWIQNKENTTLCHNEQLLMSEAKEVLIIKQIFNNNP